jgi:rhamnogalacturonyl hydrolase YesR
MWWMVYTWGEPFTHRNLRRRKKMMSQTFELIQKNDRDSKTGLFYHGWDESKQMWQTKQLELLNFWSPAHENAQTPDNF